MSNARMGLDSPSRPDWSGERPLPDIASWKVSPPAAGDFTSLIDDLGCSDCVYDTFFWLMPHLLDVIENCSADNLRNSMLLDFGFRFIQATDHNTENVLLKDQLTSSVERVTELTYTAMEADSSSIHLHLATLAACHGDADMAIYISRFDGTY